MPAPEPRRVVIHAGFHKTGTTTVQRILKDSFAGLSPHLCIILRSDISDLCAAAHDFARAPSDMSRARFRDQARACFAQLPTQDTRPILISAEDLSGLIPGRNGRVGYPQAPILLAELMAAFPDTTAPHLYLSIRQTAPWLASCYAHHLRHAPMRLSEAAFLEKQADAPTLQQIASDIGEHVGHDRLTVRAIEDLGKQPEGLLSPMLDLAGVPPKHRHVIRPHRKSNPSMPPDVLAKFLILNREETDAAKRNAAKHTLISDRRRGQT